MKVQPIQATPKEVRDFKLWEKGCKYDTLKQRNDELVEALEDCLIDVVKRCTDLKLDCTKYSTYIKANKALKSNEND